MKLSDVPVGAREIGVLGYTIEELLEMENFAKEHGWKRPEYPTLTLPEPPEDTNIDDRIERAEEFRSNTIV